VVLRFLKRRGRTRENVMPVETREQTETPVLDTLAALTAVSIENCELDPREMMVARLAALVAVNAPPASYLLNGATAADIGITVDDVEGILIAVAPIVGVPRVATAARNMARAFGFAIAALEAEEDLDVTND
jgi:alkylhydroperoxidase/carboxymuconolactone decarboxylase family protein YurZ